GIRLSRPETRRPLVPLCSALARSTRGGPGAPRGLARHSRRRSGALLARRSQAPRSGPSLTPPFADEVIGWASRCRLLGPKLTWPLEPQTSICRDRADVEQAGPGLPVLTLPEVGLRQWCVWSCPIPAIHPVPNIRHSIGGWIGRPAVDRAV